MSTKEALITNIFIFRVLTSKATAAKANNVVIEDLPKKLPSVRNLASIFTPTKKSPEPLPRRSLIKVRTNSKIESQFQVTYAFKIRKVQLRPLIKIVFKQCLHL